MKKISLIYLCSLLLIVINRGPMLKNIIFTGGGSGGHVVPAITLIKSLDKNRYKIHYIGGRKSIEKELTASLGIPYYGIYNGKLRRYFSLENFTDIFKLGIGVLQAFGIMLRFRSKDTLLFSTGGFVSLPAVFAAWLTGKKIFIHEQTSRVGLANKIASRFATKVFVSFEDSVKFFPKEKTLVSGYPLRDACFTTEINDVQVGGQYLTTITKPLLFVTGGGNGSGLLNELIKKNLEVLTQKYFIIHQVGKNFMNEFAPLKNNSYLPLPFLGEEMIDVYKKSTLVISRSGAGTVCELMALKKKSLFIPLKIAQKNEQYHNAMEAKRRIGALVVTEDDLPKTDFLKLLEDLEKIQIPEGEKNNNNAKEFLLKEIQAL